VPQVRQSVPGPKTMGEALRTKPLHGQPFVCPWRGLSVQKKCHPDRSVAQWRDLLFLSATSKFPMEAPPLDLSSRATCPGLPWEPRDLQCPRSKLRRHHQPLNPLEADPPRDLHVPRPRPFRALQPRNRAERLIIQNWIRHVEVSMVKGIGRLCAKLKL
jgi:hypothetical protein